MPFALVYLLSYLLTSGRGPGRIALARTLEVLAHEAQTTGLDLDVATGTNSDGHGPASAIVAGGTPIAV